MSNFWRGFCANLQFLLFFTSGPIKMVVINTMSYTQNYEFKPFQTLSQKVKAMHIAITVYSPSRNSRCFQQKIAFNNIFTFECNTQISSTTLKFLQ